MQFLSQDYRLSFTRLFGVLLILINIIQLTYFIHYQNTQYPVLAVVFIFSIFLTTISTIISVLNSWFYKKPRFYKVIKGFEPQVGIIIPTCGEPVKMILNTINSVLKQDWPTSKMIIIISDDGNSAELKNEIEQLAKLHTNIKYFLPPNRFSPIRRGTAKAGNLNAALNYIQINYPKVQFIETRDADDLVGCRDFLRFTLGTLLSDSKISFVQTIKKTRVSKGDPFLNHERLFYERTLQYRSSVNAAFPCGSGVVWRISELLKINGFPTWNLVEDLQSGFESLKMGGTGEYLPIVGTVGQSAPEDIPNYYKQRGTWAIDTLRLFFWRNAFFKNEMTIWQKLQFFELGFSYLLSLVTFIFVYAISSCLAYSVCAVSSKSFDLFEVSFSFIVIMEIYNILRNRGLPYKEIWKSRQTWVGLQPVFAIAIFKALFYGPYQKPTYKVTRKNSQFAFYWKEVLLQILMVSVLSISILYKLAHISTLIVTDVVLIFWASFLIYGFSRVIRNSFYGVNFKYYSNVSLELLKKEVIIQQ